MNRRRNEYMRLRLNLESIHNIMRDFRPNTSLNTVAQGYESMIKEMEKHEI